MRLEHLLQLPPSLLAFILVVGSVSADTATTIISPGSATPTTAPAPSAIAPVVISTLPVTAPTDTKSTTLLGATTHISSASTNTTKGHTTLSTSYLFPFNSSASLLPSNTTSNTTSTSSPILTDPDDDGGSGSDSDDDDDDDRSRSAKWITTYYYVPVCIAIVLVIAVASMYMFRRRHKKNMRNKKVTARQRALAQDVDGMTSSAPGAAAAGAGGNGRWFNPGHYWRGGGVGAAGMAGLAALGLTRRREEGLDEQGMAPPPYKPEDMGDDAGGNRSSGSSGENIQLGSLSLDGRRVSKPPTYHEVIEEVPDEEEREGEDVEVRSGVSSATSR